MKALLDQVGAKTAIIAGLSLGGYMSLAFAASHPDRVRALMLFDTGPGFKKDEARAKWNETARQRAANLEAKGLAALNSERRGQADAPSRRQRGWPVPRAACWPRTTIG